MIKRMSVIKLIAAASKAAAPPRSNTERGRSLTLAHATPFEHLQRARNSDVRSYVERVTIGANLRRWFGVCVDFRIRSRKEAGKYTGDSHLGSANAIPVPPMFLEHALVAVEKSSHAQFAG
jgi:hypothetical protein